MAELDFNVKNIEAVRVIDGPALNQLDWMSPYVWEEDGAFRMLARGVPRNMAEAGSTGSIYLGRSQDGLAFDMEETPVLAPSDDPADCGGCEDPTLVMWQGAYVVYYTGVERSGRTGQLLYATGPDLRKLKRRGVAHCTTQTEGNIKEATIERTADNRWRLFYEFAHDNASRIGLALGDDVAGPWMEQSIPFDPRPEAWDSWHLSTGPLLTSNPDWPVMFYNGATEDARWRIGWIAFDRGCTRVVDRCVEPLVMPPPLERDATDIAFAASVIARGDHCWLYYSLADRALFRATIRSS